LDDAVSSQFAVGTVNTNQEEKDRGHSFHGKQTGAGNSRKGGGGKRCAPEQLGVAGCVHPGNTVQKLRRVFVQRFYSVPVASQIIGLHLAKDRQVVNQVLPAPLFDGLGFRA
jgi:hypothetical protein